MVAGMDPDRVFVQVVDVDVAAGREISFGKSLAERLGDRQEDIQAAIEAGSQTVASSIDSLRSPPGWRLGEVSASFGITLTAEAGVIMSKASAGATLEVSVKFTRG
jgi:Trypsin-co-occurring domain 1